MKGKLKHMDQVVEGHDNVRSAVDLLRMMGGRSKPVHEKGRPSPDSMLAVYKDRVTYTFILEDEVASIHFDRSRGEIFFKGHNVHNLSLSEKQKEALVHMKDVMANDSKAKSFLSDYCATLDRFIADK